MSGLFWNPEERRSRSGPRGPRTPTPGPIPDTGWNPPTNFPNLSAAKTIAIDVETYDPRLKTHGPGFVRGDGFVAGISIGADHDGRWYFPVAHADYTQHNFNQEQVYAWLNEVLAGTQPKVGANLFYDIGWLNYYGVTVNGRLIDVQYAEPLLNENRRSYALEKLCAIYGLTGKVDDLLNKWCAQTFGGEPTRGQQITNYYRSPAELVGPYAESDVDQPLLIWEKQRVLLEREGLMDLFDMECGLIPLLLDMYRQGVKVNIDKVPEVEAGLTKLLNAKKDIIKGVDIWSAGSIAHFMDKEGIAYPKTGKGNPSFTAPWLENHASPYCNALRDARKYDKMISTFIQGHIVDKEHNGVIHPSFHPLRGDKGGTVSGRFSSSNPNIQQIPSRDPELAPLIRGLFEAFDTTHRWRRYDYSQIEYRLLVHYALGLGAKEVRQAYIEDPTTDFHELTRKLIKRVTGVQLERKPTKSINFGLCYGMGLDKLAATLGLDKTTAQNLLDAYHAGTPFVRKTFDKASQVANGRGYVKTLLGRRRRFELWEPRDYNLRYEVSPTIKPEQLRDLIKPMKGGHKGVQRANTHKALNSVLQGGSADMIKMAMYQAYKDGLFDVTGVPLLQVHDELGFSDAQTPETEEAFAALVHVMENCVPLKIPVLVDCEIGPDWGHLSKLSKP